jgi:NADP-dependent 3-hydroxy acid dehydrogenase YdfG
VDRPRDFDTAKDVIVSTENRTGPVAVLTGASSGIGEATARALVAGGYRVALLARRLDRIQALAGEFGDGAIAIEADVSDRDSIVAAARRVKDQLNISSVAGRTARAGNAVYAATKWGINGWSESLRQQLQPDVRVIAIEPGAVATELTDRITDAETKASAEQMYEANSIAPEDVAEIIAFAVTRPRSVSLNEILVRPTGQAS